MGSLLCRCLFVILYIVVRRYVRHSAEGAYVLCRSLWPTVTLLSQSAFCLKNQPSFTHTSLVSRSLFCGFFFRENCSCTTARQNVVDVNIPCCVCECEWSCATAFQYDIGTCSQKKLSFSASPLAYQWVKRHNVLSARDALSKIHILGDLCILSAVELLIFVRFPCDSMWCSVMSSETFTMCVLSAWSARDSWVRQMSYKIRCYRYCYYSFVLFTWPTFPELFQVRWYPRAAAGFLHALPVTETTLSKNWSRMR